MKRRNVLALVGAGVTSTSGCLRLQSGGDSTPQESSTPEATSSDETTSTGTQSTGTSGVDGSNEVTLTESWTDENGVDNIWTRDNTFYYNDYNYAAEASHGDGISWSTDTTYDGIDANLGADAFAADGRYVVFGYTPDPGENEEWGAHFHAYQRYDGEEIWSVGAPSDGKHINAAGATVVGNIAVLATSGFGRESEQEPLLYGVDIETGETVWQTDQSVLPAALLRYLGSFNGDVYLGTTKGVRVLASETGEVTETHGSWYISRDGLESLGRMHGETLFAGWQDRVDAHPAGNNGVSWSNTVLGRISTTPAADNSLVVVGTEDGNVYAFERGSGETRWEASITNPVAAIETTGSHVWVGDTDIGLTAYDRETGALVHRSTKPVNGDDIAVADDVLLLGGDTATAYTID